MELDFSLRKDLIKLVNRLCFQFGNKLRLTYKEHHDKEDFLMLSSLRLRQGGDLGLK